MLSRSVASAVRLALSAGEDSHSVLTSRLVSMEADVVSARAEAEEARTLSVEIESKRRELAQQLSSAGEFRKRALQFLAVVIVCPPTRLLLVAVSLLYSAEDKVATGEAQLAALTADRERLEQQYADALATTQVMQSSAKTVITLSIALLSDVDRWLP